MKYKHIVLLLTALLLLNNSIFSMQSETSFLNIILKTIDDYKIINNDLINQLVQQNPPFRGAVHYYIRCALENLQTVTCDTLHTINDAHAMQPKKELNELPLSIKAYVMSQAYHDLPCKYDIVLSSHSNIVTLDICATNHSAFTVHYDGSGIMWNLITGKQILRTPANTFSGKVWPAFNSDGSQLAVATTTDYPKKNIITIYFSSIPHTYSIETTNTIIGLKYLKDGQIPTICAYTKDTKKNNGAVFAELWLTQENRAIFLGSTESQAPSIYMSREFGDYSVKMPSTEEFFLKTHITITKNKNCQPFYLCLQAIQQAYCKKQFDTIRTSPLFTQTTEYEKKIIEFEIEKKILSQKNHQQPLLRTNGATHRK